MRSQHSYVINGENLQKFYSYATRDATLFARNHGALLSWHCTETYVIDLRDFASRRLVAF